MRRTVRQLGTVFLALSLVAGITSIRTGSIVHADSIPTQTPVTLNSATLCDTDGNGTLDTPEPSLTDGDLNTAFSQDSENLICAIEIPDDFSLDMFALAYSHDTNCGLGELSVNIYGYNGDPTLWSAVSASPIYTTTSAATSPQPVISQLSIPNGEYTWLVFDITHQQSTFSESYCNPLGISEIVPHGSQPVAGAAGDTEQTATCAQVALTGLEYILPDGTLSSTSVSGAGQLYTFANGTTQAILPSGFNAATASDAALHAYGLPDRPTDPQALGQWLADWGDLQGGNVEPGYCIAPRTNSASTISMSNWDGYENVGTSSTAFAQLSGRFIQPHWDAVCPHASGHSIWVGLGGDSRFSKNLLQIGTDVPVVPGDLDAHNVAFFEAHDTADNYDTDEAVFKGSYVTADSQVQASVFYSSGSVSLAEKVTNSTSNVLYSTGSMSTIDGYAASRYYNGRTAEWMDERPGNAGSYPVDGTYYYYRKLRDTTHQWTNAITGRGVALGDGPGVTLVYMKRPNGTVLGETSGLTSSTSFTSAWERCS